MNKVYGYVRVSTKNQSIERQITNIQKYCEDAKIYSDKYSGKTMNRENWQKLYKQVKTGDTIVFDEISRLSRNAKEGFSVYQELYAKGVNLVFLKERHLDTSVYRESMKQKIKLKTKDKIEQMTVDFLNNLSMEIAKRQIEIAFQQAENERKLLSQRVKEGLAKARANGIELGRPEGQSKADWNGEKKKGQYQIKKEIECKPKILKHSKTFGGTLSNKEVMKMLNLSKNTLYKYILELKLENAEQ